MKILVAIDGSMFSQAAIQTIAAGIRSQDADVLLLHVIEPPAVFEPDPLRQRLARAEQWLKRAARQLGTSGFEVETRMIEGEARTGILSVALQWQPDLIVLGSHGRKGLDRFLMGSVAESVALHTSCSVLIVRVPWARCAERVLHEYLNETQIAPA